MKRYLAATLAVVPLVANAAAAAGAADVAAAHWAPRAALSAAAAARLPVWCEGAYLERDYPQPLSSDAAAHPIAARANRVRYKPDGGAELEGGVVLEQGNRRLAGERVSLRDAGSVAALPAGAALSEPGLALAAAAAELNLTRQEGHLQDARFVWFAPAFRGGAASAARRGATTRLEEARLTRCDPGVDTWELAAAEVSVTAGEAFARARGVALKVKGVPVFYAPRLRIPWSDERQSGFLFPNLSASGDNGIDLGVPYYLNLHPQYDATVTPRYIERRGAGLEIEARALNRFARTTVGGAVLADDALRREAVRSSGGAGSTSARNNRSRWLANIDSRARFGAFSARIDYAAVSDIDYFRDLGTDLAITSRPFLTRFAAARFDRGRFSAGIGGLGFQWLSPRAEPYRRVPEIDASYVGGTLGPLDWSVAGAWTAFDRPQARGNGAGGLAAVTGRRLHLEPTARLPLTRTWGFLNLGAGYRYTRYDLDGAAPTAANMAEPFDANPRRRIAFGDIDAGLFFEREANWRGVALVHTLEPRLYYLRQQFADQSGLPRFDPGEPTFSFEQLFRRNRFSGLDRIGDADQLALGATTRLVDAASGRERLRASLGAIAYFSDRRVALQAIDEDDAHATSPVVGALAARFGRFDVRADFVWDPADAETDELGLAFQYRRDNRRIFNVGHRKRGSFGIDQSDVSFIWPLGRKWSALGRWSYDFDVRRTNEVFAGLEYATCCWQARAVYRRFVASRGVALNGLDPAAADEDEGVLLQFVFRGLADVGGRLESALARGIKGYRREPR